MTPSETARCRACQKPLYPDAKFCPECGARIVRAAAPSDPIAEALRQPLGSSFEIVRLIGRGGMGAVYLARERALERPVAIKVLPPERAHSEKDRQRFRREAQTAARLTHPNIVPLHSFGEAGELLYFIMGYVEGEPLSERLLHLGKLPAAEARTILAQLASALDYAHRRGVVHRDVKPENVILDAETGAPMLTDFGIARAEGSGATLTETGNLVGTPYYMSPEQVSGSAEIGGESDIYSLGVVGYMMLAGRVPFDGATPREVLLQHLTAEPPPLERLAPDTPSDLIQTIHRCLAKRPADRPPAGALGESLKSPTPGDPTLSESLEGLESRGFWMIAVTIVSLYAALFGWGMRRELGPIAMTFVRIVVAVPIMISGSLLVLALAEARRAGVRWREIATIALRPPGAWGFWYPISFRRPGDVWDRLPQPVKRLRLAVSAQAIVAYLGLMPALLLALPIISSGGSGADRWLLVSLVVATVATFAPLSYYGWSCHRWLRKQSFETRDLQRIMSVSTSKRSFWTNPRIARILAAEPAAETRARERTPREALERIVRLAPRLPPRLREAADGALAAARMLAARLESVESEVRRSADQSDPGEAARIASRLEALERQVPLDPERLEMRQLLTDQLALLHRVQERRRAAEAQKQRLAALLATMADELEKVTWASGADPAGRLRELCRRADMAREGDFDATYIGTTE